MRIGSNKYVVLFQELNHKVKERSLTGHQIYSLEMFWLQVTERAMESLHH